MTHLTLPFFIALAAAFVAALLLSAVPASTEAVHSQAAPSPTPGVGGSVSLNGTTAYGEAPHSTELSTTGSWTVELWFKDENGGFSHPRQRLLTKGDVLAGDVPYWLSIGDGAVQAGVKAGGVIRSTSASLVAKDPAAWHHLAVTLDASSRQLTVYLDGTLAAQTTLATISSGGNSAVLSFGRTSAASGQYFRGNLDDVRVWNVQRTAAEIGANYQGALAAPRPGLVGNWRFDESAGTVAVDVAGATADNATLFGGAGWSLAVRNAPPTQAPSATATGTTSGPTASAVPSSPMPTLPARPEGLTTVQFTGPVSGKSVVFNIYLPTGYNASPQRYPVLYHLHGSGANSYASDNDLVINAITGSASAGVLPPMIIVFADNNFPTGNSSWGDSSDGTRPGETEVIHELIPYVDSNYRTVGARGGRVIQGMSMGGNGVVEYAYKFPELFCCAVGYASALLDSFAIVNNHHPGVFSDENYWQLYSPWASLLRNLDPIRANGIAVRLIIGGLDSDPDGFLLDKNRTMRDNLVAFAVPVEYAEVPGVDHVLDPLIRAEGSNSARFIGTHLTLPALSADPTATATGVPTVPSATASPSPTWTTTATAPVTPTASATGTVTPMRTATPTPTPTQPPTASGSAVGSLAFNGAAAYAEAPHATELNTGASWTVELWVKDENGTFNHGRQRLLTKGDPLVASDVPYWLSIMDGGVQVGVKTGGAVYSTSVSLGAAAPAAWHHLAASLDGSSRRLTVYVDGLQTGQATLPAAAAVAGNTAPLSFGRTSGTGAQYFRGKIDDVRLWNTARTAADVAAGYRAEVSCGTGALLGYWRFNEGAGVTGRDCAGNVLEDATLQGGASFSADVPFAGAR